MKRVLCIWLPNWPLQRLVVAQPELKDRAVILHHRDARRGQCVAACSRVARHSGVQLGMPLAEATALVAAQLPAGAHVVAYDPQADLEQLQRLAQWCERFSPLVGLEVCEEPVQRGSGEPECLLLDVTSLGPLFGGEEGLAQRVARAFEQRGYGARLGLADTIGAAWAAARYRPLEGLDLPPPAAAYWVLPPGQSQRGLASLPLAALRLALQTQQLLEQLGITRVDQLLELPRSGLSSRFGDRLLQRLDQALGIAPELIVAHRPPPQYQAQWLLEHPVAEREAVDWIVVRLVQRLATMLLERGQGAIQLECRLDGQAARPLLLRVALFRPTAEPRYLVDLLRMQLERVTLPQAVARVALRAITTAPLEYRQGELFADHARQVRQGLAQLIDRLSSRLGSQAVLRGYLQSDAQPERASRYRAWAGRRRARGRQRRQSPAGPPPPALAQRPLLLRTPPVPLEVIAVAPDGPPAQFSYRGQTFLVARHWGPERIETGWWRGRCIRRDYYRVETQSGQRFWLFRQLRDGMWHLHGEFE